MILGTFGSATAIHAAPPEVYGRLPRLENFALSPDGSRIAFVRTEDNTRIVSVTKLGTSETLGLRVGEQKLRSISWADNDRLMIVSSVTTVPLGYIGDNREWFHMQVFDLRTRDVYPVPRPENEQMMNVIWGEVMVRRLKDRTALFVGGLLQTPRELAPALIRVDLETRDSHVIRPGKVGILGWLVDNDGEIMAEETYNEADQRWSIFTRRAGHMQEAMSGQEPIDFPRLLGWGPSADTLLVQSLEDGNAVWRLLSLKDGSTGEPMVERKSLDWPIEDRRTHRMIGGVHVGDSEEYVFFDPALQASWESVLRAFRDERVLFESASADFRKMIVRVEGAKDGYCYMLVDLDTHQATHLGDVYAGVTQPFEVRRITYAAGDGLQITAYLTLPRNKTAQKLPLIVLPHGGPAVQDTADFDWWAQALAAQGYAVLKPNYRGSDLGWEFMAKGFGEWGRKMQTDLSDGVRYLAREGIVDPARVCIVGASYGGYAALAGPALDPGVYRCAVSVAGIADIRQMLTWTNDRQRRKNNRSQRYWDRYMGITGPSDPRVDSISPIRHTSAINVPILLIHGKQDTVVPFQQSQSMYDALRKQSKDVQLVTLREEDHWLSRSATRLQMLESSLAFLQAHNPPDQSP